MAPFRGNDASGSSSHNAFTFFVEFHMSNGRLATIAASTLLVGSSVSMLWGHGGDTTQIHSCVAKDGTIRIVDATTTCKSQETALDWSITGPQGPQGPQGDPGPQGPRGPSDAYVADAGLNPQEFAITNNEVTVATLSLPEGNYALNAKVLVGNRDAAEAEIVCTLRWAQSGLIDIAGVRLFGGAPFATGSLATLPLAGSFAVGAAGENVRIQCGSTSPGGFAQYGKLNAVKVETLTNQ